jgi:hypothetical protein
MDQNGILSIIALVVSVGGSILALVNHKRVRSSCCGKVLDVSLDVENTTPPKIAPVVESIQSPPIGKV